MSLGAAVTMWLIVMVVLIGAGALFHQFTDYQQGKDAIVVSVAALVFVFSGYVFSYKPITIIGAVIFCVGVIWVTGNDPELMNSVQEIVQ